MVKKKTTKRIFEYSRVDGVNQFHLRACEGRNLVSVYSRLESTHAPKQAFGKDMGNMV